MIIQAEQIDTAPDRSDVFSHLDAGRAVPIYRELLADLETPVSAYLKLAGDGPAFLLESAEPDESVGRYSFVGSDPYLLMTMRDGQVTRTADDGSVARDTYKDPLDYVAAELSAVDAVKLPQLPAFQGGAVGYLAYETVESFERLPHTRIDDLPVPDVQLMFVDSFVVFDNNSRSLKLVALARPDPDPESGYRDALRRLDRLASRLAGPIPNLIEPPANSGGAGELISNMTRAEHAAIVKTAKEYIAAGDIIQAVLSLRYQTQLGVHPFAVYRHLRQLNPSPYMFFLQLPDLHVCGASPEMLVRVHDGEMHTVPVAGTRWRGEDAESDDRIAAELLADEKEVAEHVMLVDLGRNDIGRVADAGTVSVSRLLAVDRFSHVMHIVSQVDGRLADGRAPVDALRSCFPAGTLSGAPKIRALEIIDELEPTRRGVYGGAVGYFAYSGDLDTAIAIRTMVARDGCGYVQVGGGIVADSQPDYEYREIENKAGAILAAIERARGSNQ